MANQKYEELLKGCRRTAEKLYFTSQSLIAYKDEPGAAAHILPRLHVHMNTMYKQYITLCDYLRNLSPDA